MQYIIINNCFLGFLGGVFFLVFFLQMALKWIQYQNAFTTQIWVGVMQRTSDTKINIAGQVIGLLTYMYLTMFKCLNWLGVFIFLEYTDIFHSYHLYSLIENKENRLKLTIFLNIISPFSHLKHQDRCK